MLSNKYGKIIGISSIVGSTGNPGQANYVASKSGLSGLYKSIALEVARRNINVNLSDNSNLIFCETTIFGRKAMFEKIKNISFSDQWKIYTNSSIKHFEAINIKGSVIDNLKNNYTFDNQSSLSTILIFGDIIHQLESELSKVTKSLENHYCEMTKFDDKIVIRCLADDNYDLKKTLNFIMKNIINDKLPKSWDL